MSRPANKIHYIYQLGGHQIIWCNNYWAVGLPCPFCKSFDKIWFQVGCITVGRKERTK